MTHERARLAKGITERDAGRRGVAVAGDTVSRAQAMLRAARSRLASFGDVDAALLAHNAASFKTAAAICGPAPNLTLPNELLEKKKARDDAAAAHAAAQSAHDTLVSEYAAAQRSLDKAESRVSECAAQVLVAETAEQGLSLAEVWTSLWATVDSLNGLRTSGVQLPPEIVRTLQGFEAMDHRMFAGGHNAQLARAFRYWKAYRASLCKSADAQEPEPIDGGGAAPHARSSVPA